MLSSEEVKRVKRSAARFSIIAAVLLTVFKLSVGMVTNSLAILSLVVDSFFDIAGSTTAYLSIRVSGRPPDLEHRYGHGKIENLGGLLITSLLLVTMGNLAYEAFSRLFKTVSISFVSIGLVGMMVCIVADLGVSWYLKRTATRYNSQVLEANSIQFRMDIFTQSLVIVGLVFVNMGYPSVDAFVALLVSGYIGYLGVGIGKKAVDVLLDRAPADIVRRVEDAVKGCEGVLRYEDLRVRTSGSQTFIDMRLYVPRVYSLEQAHNVASDVEKRVKDVVSDADVIVHVEAEEARGKEKAADKVRLIAAGVSGIKGVHDLWVRRVEGVFEIDAHIQVDSDLSLSEAHRTASLLEDRLKKEFGGDSIITTHIDTEVDRVIHQPLKETSLSVVKSVETMVLDLEEIKSCDNVSVKRFDNELHVSVSCTLKKDLKVKDAHAVAEKIEALITANVKGVSKVFVHTEPPSS